MRLILGDSFNIIKDFKDDYFDAIVTDPPYGIGKDYHNKEQADNPEDYYHWIYPIYLEMLRVLKPGGFFAMWQVQKYMKYFWEWYGQDIHIFAAAKNWIQLFQVPFNAAYDPIVMFYKAGAKPLEPKEKVSRDFYLSDTTPRTRTITKEQHPCPRPMDVCEHIIKNFVVENGKVFDPFMGSGNIGIAAERNNRIYTGIEIDGRYFEFAKSRLNQLKLLGWV